MNPVIQTAPAYSQLGQIGTARGALSRVVELEVQNMQFTDAFLRHISAGCAFVIASFPPNSEPLVHGMGATQSQAIAVATMNHSDPSQPLPMPEGALICARDTTSQTPRWRSAAGQIVEHHHCLPQRKETQS